MSLVKIYQSFSVLIFRFQNTSYCLFVCGKIYQRTNNANLNKNKIRTSCDWLIVKKKKEKSYKRKTKEKDYTKNESEFSMSAIVREFLSNVTRLGTPSPQHILYPNLHPVI